MSVHAPHPLARTWRIMGPLAGCVGVILAGCSSTRQASNLPPNAPRATPPTRTAEPSRTQSQRNDLALFAMSLLDTRYTWGGRGPATGFDCSGLVSHVYREAVGIPVKGTSAELGRQSRPIDRSQLQPGDLVFFNTLGTRHSHVGVYVGNNKFVHASNPRTGVRMDALSNRYYAQRFEGAQTLLD